MKLIVVRHGQTNENINGINQGHLDTELNQTGITQAKKVALRLKNEKIEVVFCSDLKRARQTCQEIMKFHESLAIKFTDLLREQNLGIFEGMPAELHSNRLKELNIKYSDYNNETGENMKQVTNRAMEFLEMLKPYKNKTILVVSHGGFIIQLMLHLFNKKDEDYQEFLHENTAVSVVELNNYPVLKLCKCTKHLEN